MVFFTCNLCGESVKKPAVEKHYLTRCRGNTKSVSCMDCLKDFYGEDYVAHTKCISEAQKYSGKDFVPKESKNSNAKKQESWMDIIRAILESSDYNLTDSVRNAFQRLQSVDNVPRKKAKFENFVANCMRMPKAQATQVWDILEKELNKMKEAKQAQLAAAKEAKEAKKNGAEEKQNEGKEAEKPSKKSKLKEQKENGQEETEAPPSKKAKQEVDDDSNNKFDWATELDKLVAKQTDGIFLEKLKKKLLKKYLKHQEVEELNDKKTKKFYKSFDKHLKKNAALQLDGDLVKQRC